MAKKIHKVRYLSSRDNFLELCCEPSTFPTSSLIGATPQKRILQRILGPLWQQWTVMLVMQNN
jgi:hypothetical protein